MNNKTKTNYIPLNKQIIQQPEYVAALNDCRGFEVRRYIIRGMGIVVSYSNEKFSSTIR